MNVDAREPEAALDDASLLELFWCFLVIGLVSFGGSSRAMMHRETVERRRWLREPDFLTGFAIAQVLPGANPVNLALYIGLRMRGWLGATMAVLGMLLPAFCIIMLMGFAYRELARFPATHFVLDGVAAAGVAATLAVGFKVAVRLERNAWSILLALATFVTVGVLHLPMIPVVCVTVPLGVAVAYFAGGSYRG
jgi:chromate transporter